MSGRPRAWAAQLNRGALGARREDVDVSITLTDQDEYTHDVLVPLGPPLYLAYDVS